jgi:ankyrin repeat protein
MDKTCNGHGPSGNSDDTETESALTQQSEIMTFFPPFTRNHNEISDGEDGVSENHDDSEYDDSRTTPEPTRTSKEQHSPATAAATMSPRFSVPEDDDATLGDTSDSRCRTYSSSVVEKGMPTFSVLGSGNGNGNGNSTIVVRSRSQSYSSARSAIASQDQVQFHAAISKRDYKKVKNMLIEVPRLVKCVDEFNRTPLHAASELGDMISIELLIQYNADVDALDARNRSCIHLCSDAAAARVLCEEGATISIPDKNGYLPLHSFTIDANKECIKVLLEYGADPMIAEPITMRTSLHLAADSGDFELLSLLVLNSTIPIDANVTDAEGNTPLHLVLMNTNPSAQQLRCVMLLLDKGASVTIANKRGITPLHYACGNRFFGANSLAEPIIHILLEMSADPNARDNDNCTPLIIACAHREWDLCRALFEAGADMNIPCPMSSYMLQEGFGRDVTAAGLIELEDCTASDLMQRQIRSILFCSICVAQTEIPFDSRDRCMNCANAFNDRANSTGSFTFAGLMSNNNGGRVHCRHCNRVTCTECTNKTLPRSSMPPFIQETCSDRDLKLCFVCYDILAVQAPH